VWKDLERKLHLLDHETLAKILASNECKSMTKQY